MKTFHINKPFIVMALNIIDTHKQCVHSERKVLKDAIGSNPHKMVGSYKGVEETSYITFYPTDEAKFNHAISKAKHIGRLYSQESILVVDQYRNARLVFCDHVEPIPDVLLGKWIECNEATAKLREAWSYFPLKDKYYICR